MKFYTKITLLMFIAGFLPLISIGIISITNVEKNIESTANDSLTTLSAEVSKEVWRPIDEGFRNLSLLSRNPVVQERGTPLEDLHGELVNTRNFNRIFKDISLVNMSGQVRTSVFYTFRNEWTGTAWFQSALNGLSSISDPFVPESGSHPLLVVAVPVFDGQGDQTGILVGEYDMGRIWTITGSVPVQNGELFVIDGYGRAISPSSSHGRFEFLRFQEIRESLELHPAGVRTVHEGGEDLVVAFTSLPPVESNGADLLGWTLILSQPRGEVYAPLLRARYALLITAGICLGIINILAYFLSSTIHVRVNRLVRAARQIGEGNFSEKVRDLGRDEIGELGQAFNWASEQLSLSHENSRRAEVALKRSHVELESQVQRRTAQLAHEAHERKQAEEASTRAREEAEAANRAKSDFLASMSHELRTPLNHIIGFTEMVADRKFGTLNEAQEEVLSDVLVSSRHLLSLINDILDLSKVEAGKMDFNPTPVDLRELIEKSTTMVKEKALKHGLQLTTEINSIPETVMADERKLKQIVYNLLSNAVKFTPDGGRIVIAAGKAEMNGDDGESPRDHVQLSVSDTGIGLKEEHLKRIFEPFEQVENEKQSKAVGTGLGLALTKQFVEMHGGRIWAESAGEGSGATFFVVLPVELRAQNS
jgi:signal transduction histidine kinase